FIIVFIGIYYSLLAMTPFAITINTLWNTFFHIIAKSIIILFFTTILSNNIYYHQKIIIPSVDMILSFGILFVKLENTTYPRMLIPHRGQLQLMVLITIGYCLIVIDSFIILPSLFIFTVLSIFIISLIAKFLISICNGAHHDYIKVDNERLYTSDKYNTLIRKIKEQVNEYYSSAIDRYTIALQCEMHPDYISKIFKSEEGITINKYIQIVRLEKAHHLLLYSDKKIIEVAFDVGYENLATFYRHFIKQYKKSPRQIRKEKLKG
ncbi:MAG: helix-turn-helix domain-containing protein, partial [Spirochaetota bacterium]